MVPGVQSEFGPTWYADFAAVPEPRVTLNFDLDVDVCVIGGGLAGLTVAREVARRGWSVAVLEAERFAWNASGRNSGFVVPGYPAPIEKIIERIGLPATRVLWKLSETGVHYVRDTIAAFGLPALVEGRGWLDVWQRPAAATVADRVALLGQVLGSEVETWSPERVRDVLKSERYFEAIHFPGAFQINPLAYALRLAATAEQAGAHLFERTPALSIDPAGVRKRIVTPNGRVRAGHVVLAGNVRLGAIARQIAETLVPITAHTGVTKPLGARLARAITFSGAVSDSRNGDYHYRIVDGDRLLWTGAAAVSPRHPRRTARRFAHAIRAIYPQLGRVEFEHFWSGEMGFAIHRMPQIGAVQPGVWLASGFGSQGLNTAAMAGVLIARGIVESDDTWRAFNPYDLVWAGGALGRAVVRAKMSWQRTREAVTAGLGRRRDARRRRRSRVQEGLPAEAPKPAYRLVAASELDPGPRDRVPAETGMAAPVVAPTVVAPPVVAPFAVAPFAVAPPHEEVPIARSDATPAVSAVHGVPGSAAVAPPRALGPAGPSHPAAPFAPPVVDGAAPEPTVAPSSAASPGTPAAAARPVTGGDPIADVA